MTESESRAFLRSMSDLRKGRFGEAVFKQVLIKSGLKFIPLCDIQNGRAPLLTGQSESVILPDMAIISEGISAYMDAKAKTQSIMYENWRQVRHGIDRTNYEHYVQMGVLDKRECGIGIVELFDYDGVTWSGSLLAESFRRLGNPIQGFSNQKHMVYWPRKSFVDLDSLTALELIALSEGRHAVNYKTALTDIFKPAPPECGQDEHQFADTKTYSGAVVRQCILCGKVIGRVKQEREKAAAESQQRSLF